MMSKRSIFIVVVIVCILGLIAVGLRSSYAEEEGDSKKTQKSLRFTVPDDWPVEERNGIVAPIPVEEYIDMKFKDIASELDSIKKDLSSKFEEVNLDVDSVKSETSDKFKEVEFSIESVAGDTKDASLSLDGVLAKLSLVENNLGDLAKELKVFKSQNENIQKQHKDLELRLGTLEQEVEDIRYQSSEEETDGWY
ncbi:hypothetical protein ACFL2Y_02005 [Candidatus Omnitrophota bacterium]